MKKLLYHQIGENKFQSPSRGLGFSRFWETSPILIWIVSFNPLHGAWVFQGMFTKMDQLVNSHVSIPFTGLGFFKVALLLVIGLVLIVSIPFTGLGFFKVKTNWMITGLCTGVSIPFTGLGFFKVYSHYQYIWGGIVSIPFTGLGFFKVAAWFEFDVEGET